MYTFPFPELLEAEATYRRLEADRAAEQARLIRQARMVARDRRSERQSSINPTNQSANETAISTWPKFLRPTWFMAKISRLGA